MGITSAKFPERFFKKYILANSSRFSFKKLHPPHFKLYFLHTKLLYILLLLFSFAELCDSKKNSFQCISKKISMKICKNYICETGLSKVN